MTTISNPSLSLPLNNEDSVPILRGLPNPPKELDISFKKPSIFETIKKVTWGKFFKGIIESRTFKVSIATTVVTLAAALLLTNPPNWALITVGVSAVATFMLISKAYDVYLHRDSALLGQTLGFEWSALGYGFMQLLGIDQFNTIDFRRDKRQGTIVIGVAPNLNGSFIKALNHEGITAIVNLTDDADARTVPGTRLNETEPQGVFQPYDKKGKGLKLRYDDRGNCINYKHYPIRDHIIPTGKQGMQWLGINADAIHRMVENGEKIYVHCRGGVGRSSLAICAYLIKHKGYRPSEAADCVKKSRPGATCASKKKLLCLLEFEKSL